MLANEVAPCLGPALGAALHLTTLAQNSPLTDLYGSDALPLTQRHTNSRNLLVITGPATQVGHCHCHIHAL